MKVDIFNEVPLNAVRISRFRPLAGADCSSAAQLWDGQAARGHLRAQEPLQGGVMHAAWLMPPRACASAGLGALTTDVQKTIYGVVLNIPLTTPAFLSNGRAY